MNHDMKIVKSDGKRVDIDLDKLRPIEINPENTCYDWVEQKVEKIK